jgi:hypothetical protein
MRSKPTRLAVLFAAVAAAIVPCAIAALSCAGGPIYIPQPLPNTDAGVSLDALCATACPILDQADCGVPACVALCIADQSQGIGAQLSPQCVIAAGPNPKALAACGACR